MFPSKVILFLRYNNTKQFQIQRMFKCSILKRKGGNIQIKQFSSNILNKSKSTDRAKLSNANRGPWSLISGFISNLMPLQRTGSLPCVTQSTKCQVKAKLLTQSNKNIYSLCNASTKVCAMNKQNVYLLNSQESFFRK